MAQLWDDGRLNEQKWEEVDGAFHEIDEDSGRRCPPAPCKKKRRTTQPADEEDPFGIRAMWDSISARQLTFTPEDELKHQLAAAMSEDEALEIRNRFVVRYCSEQFRKNHGRNLTLSEGAQIFRIVTLKYPMVFPISGM